MRLRFCEGIHLIGFELLAPCRPVDLLPIRYVPDGGEPKPHGHGVSGRYRQVTAEVAGIPHRSAEAGRSPPFVALEGRFEPDQDELEQTFSTGKTRTVGPSGARRPWCDAGPIDARLPAGDDMRSGSGATTAGLAQGGVPASQNVA